MYIFVYIDTYDHNYLYALLILFSCTARPSVSCSLSNTNIVVKLVSCTANTDVNVMCSYDGNSAETCKYHLETKLC